MEYRKKSVKNWFIWFLVAIILSLPLFASLNFSFSTYAESEIEYSSVLDDLHKDENFNENDYPLIADDYSLQVIQVAESVNDELFIYVYQPGGENLNLIATSINISLSSENLDFINYQLKFLNSNGVFYKYLVEDLKISETEKREYEITSIFREWISGVDKEADKVSGNTIDEVSYAVAKLYTFENLGEEIFVTCQDIQIINIESKHVGFIRYSNGFNLYNMACDSHYIAFSTDRKIEKLMEADVYYIYQKATTTYTFVGGIGGSTVSHTNYGQEQEGYAHPKYIETVTNDPLFGKEYSWDRIETINDFKSNLDEYDIELTDDVETSLNGKEWVLRFLETDYNVEALGGLGANRAEYWTKVSNVSILRLKFETAGEIYDLGVIDNKQTGKETPDNENPTPWWVWLILGILALLLVLVLLPFFPGILSFILNVFVFILKGIWLLVKGIWWLITAPFSIFNDDE